MSYSYNAKSIGTGLNTISYPTKISNNLTITGTLSVGSDLTVKGSNVLNTITSLSNQCSTTDQLLSSSITSLSNQCNSNYISLSNSIVSLSNNLISTISNSTLSNLKVLNYSSNLSYNNSNLTLLSSSNNPNVWFPLDMDYVDFGSYGSNIALNNATYITGTGLNYSVVNDSYLGSNQSVLKFDGSTYFRIPSITMAKPTEHWLSLWVNAKETTNISTSNNPVISCTFDRIGGPPVLGISSYSNNKLAGFANSTVNTFPSYNSNLGFGDWNNVILRSYTTGTNWYGSYYINGTYVTQYGSTSSTDVIYVYLGGVKRYNTVATSNMIIRDVRYFDRTFDSNVDINMILSAGPDKKISPTVLSGYIPDMTVGQSSNLIFNTRSKVNNGFDIDTNNNIIKISMDTTKLLIDNTTSITYYNTYLIDTIITEDYKPVLYTNDKAKTISRENGHWYLDNINGYIVFKDKLGVTDDGTIIFNTYLDNHLVPYITYYKYGSTKKSLMTSNLNVDGNCIVSNKLYINNDTFLNSNITVIGNSTLSNNLTVNGITSLLSNLNVSGITTLSSNLTVNSNLSVLKTSTFSSNIVLNSNINISGNPTFTGIFNASNVNISGITTLTNNLVVSGIKSTTLGGTLNVTGITTFSSNVICNSNISLLNTLNVTGITSLSNNLNVTGISTLSNNLIVSGTNTTTLGGTLNVNGITTLNNNLVVSGTYTTKLGGYVGINIIPSYQFDVSGTTRLTGTTYVGSGGGDILQVFSTTNHFYNPIGIGVNPPTAYLDIASYDTSAVKPSLLLRSGNFYNGTFDENKTQIKFSKNGDTNYNHFICTRHHQTTGAFDKYWDNAIDFYIYDGGTTIDNYPNVAGCAHTLSVCNARVGINTSEPKQALEVEGSILSSGYVWSTGANLIAGGFFDGDHRTIARRHSTTQTVATTTEGILLFDSSDSIQTAGDLDISYSAGTFTYNDYNTRLFRINVQFTYDPTTSPVGHRLGWISKNTDTGLNRYGMHIVNPVNSADWGTSMSITFTLRLVNGDYFCIKTYHNHGSTLTLGTGWGGVTTGYQNRIVITQM
jgi:hypothetical protein